MSPRPQLIVPQGNPQGSLYIPLRLCSAEYNIQYITYLGMLVSIYTANFLSLHAKRQSARRLSHVEESIGCTRMSIHMRKHMHIKQKSNKYVNILKVGRPKFVDLFVKHFFNIWDPGIFRKRFGALQLESITGLLKYEPLLNFASGTPNPDSPNLRLEILCEITSFSICFIKLLGDETHPCFFDWD